MQLVRLTEEVFLNFDIFWVVLYKTVTRTHYLAYTIVDILKSFYFYNLKFNSKDAIFLTLVSVILVAERVDNWKYDRQFVVENQIISKIEVLNSFTISNRSLNKRMTI